MEPFENATLETKLSPVAEPTAELSLATILGRLLISAVAWSIHALVSFGLLLIYFKLVPMIGSAYEELEFALPTVTELTIRLSLGFVNYSYLFLAWLVFIDGPIAIGVCYLPRRYQWVTWVWFTSYLLLAFLLVVLACLGVGLPIVDLTK